MILMITLCNFFALKFLVVKYYSQPFKRLSSMNINFINVNCVKCWASEYENWAQDNSKLWKVCKKYAKLGEYNYYPSNKRQILISAFATDIRWIFIHSFVKQVFEDNNNKHYKIQNICLDSAPFFWNPPLISHSVDTHYVEITTNFLTQTCKPRSSHTSSEIRCQTWHVPFVNIKLFISNQIVNF